MITDSSRISIYNYLETVFANVSDNIYLMSVPTENNTSDTEDGFVLINVGNVNDESEFDCDAYGWVRCQITAYVPKRSRGRLDTKLYKGFEERIDAAIKANTGENNVGGYYILDDDVLSMEGNEETNRGNQYHVLIKSFVVVIDQQSNSQTNNN